jgi:hypothetical protein
VQALRGHALAWRLERHDGRAECDTQERSKRATERVANDPNICIRVHESDVVVQILLNFFPMGQGRVSRDERSTCRRDTHNASRIEETVVDQSFLDAFLATLPVSAEAVAHGRPPAADARTAATEEKVVVQLVLLYRRPPTDNRDRRALNRECDRAIVVRRKDIPTEAVVVRLPPDRHALHPDVVSSAFTNQKKAKRTTSHSSVRLYHPPVPGTKYASLVIFASRRSVSRSVTSGPSTSSSSQSSAALCPRMDMCRARVTSANDGGRAVRIREVRIDIGGDVRSLAGDAALGPLGGTSAK